MDANTILEYVTTLAVIFFTFGGGALLIKGLKLFESKTKNENLIKLGRWAEQAVYWAEKNYTGGSAKQLQAQEFVAKRLKKNKLFDNFSEKQIEAEIEKALANADFSKVKTVPTPLAPQDFSIDEGEVEDSEGLKQEESQEVSKEADTSNTVTQEVK